MRILITAGNTLSLIDQVRGITNIFTGNTGALLAREACVRGHQVQLMTSHVDSWNRVGGPLLPGSSDSVQVIPYRTFEDLHSLMEASFKAHQWDAVIHAAAVNDYLCGGVFGVTSESSFNVEQGVWTGAIPKFQNRLAPKVKSVDQELWIRLVRAPKLVDLIRSRWNFQGYLVKFKLEVGVDEEELLKIAETSRRDSDANLMVANSLESLREWAWIGPEATGSYLRIPRDQLAHRVLDRVETCCKREKNQEKHG